MSGIYGIYKTSEQSSRPAENDFRKMAFWNQVYGEEVSDSFSFSGVSMGIFAERLNKGLDISKGVIQSESKISVIDAVIYNRTELIGKLSKQLKENVSDEILIFSYIAEFGYDALKDVNGDFAGAIFDKNDGSVTLFRDHMGVRPLFYYFDKDFLCFSTDIRGIVAVSDVDASISEEWIYKTIEGYNRSDLEKTEYSNIKCVKPASYIKFMVSEGYITKEVNTYWSIGEKKIKLPSDKDYQNRLRELVEDAIKIRLDAVSGLVGSELSGGLDSAVISILINRFNRECVYYSWSNPPEEQEMVENDERLRIKDICDQEGITCKYGHLNLKEGSTIVERYKKTGQTIDYDECASFRYAFPPYINTLPIAQSADDLKKCGVNVIFSGHGGDEGVSHRCDPYEMFYYKEYYHYLRYMFSTTHGQNNRIIKTLRKIRENISNEMFKKPFKSGFSSPELINRNFAEKFDPDNMPILYFFYDPIAYIKGGGSRSRLDNVALLGAYCGVRYMVPFMDYRLVDFAVSIPRYQYIRGRKIRYIYREAFRDIMPLSVYRYLPKTDASTVAGDDDDDDDSDWFEEFDKTKKEIISKLNRTYWEKYLDFDVIDQFKDAGEPKKEEEFGQIFMCDILAILGMAQVMVDKVRTPNNGFDSTKSDNGDSSCS